MKCRGEYIVGLVSLAAMSLVAHPVYAQDKAASGSEGAELNSSAFTLKKEPTSLLRLHGSLSMLKAVSGHQKNELGFGASGELAAEWGWSRTLGFELQGAWLGLADGKTDAPTGLQELNGASAGYLGAGIRLSPFPDQAKPLTSGGIWLSASGGAAFTGGTSRFALKAGLGFDFFIAEHWALGPSLGLLHVFETNQSLRPADANLLLVGIHGVYDHFASLPPKDSDGDHLIDPVDACPQEPEDMDGFQDDDGCPEKDNDLDGVMDPEDRCPLEGEDQDDFEDEDGCPDVDNDGDTILDIDDQCPMETEDRDGFKDEDGCPDVDNDQDGFLDKRDLCPNEKEVVNGFADHDGCPDTKQVKVVADHIELEQKIHFYTNSSRLRPMSYPVLYKLALFLKDHQEYIGISISGHSDRRGTDEFNAKVSLQRAEVVAAYLIKNGVSEGRVSVKGFGSERLLVEGQDPRSHLINRRVEFVVTRKRESAP